jgi:N-carbamoylputrescine amidase
LSARSTVSAPRPRGTSANFNGQSYFCDPRGQIIAEGSRDKDELVVADLDMDKIREVRNTWQFFRDRRPDLYEPIVAD